MRTKRIIFSVAILAVCLVSTALFLLGYQYDNKYTYPRYPAEKGVTTLDTRRYEHDPFLYLLDGWAFYQDALLSPDEARVAAPNAYFYIGRYAGFDLGDVSRSPHGPGTYRMTVRTDGLERAYALELPVIYSKHRLWVNGELLQSAGYGEKIPQPEHWMATFTASGELEIVVAVEDERSLYSGMVYPPAFGSPERVGEALMTRLIVHAVGCAMALLIGLLCLLIGIGTRFARPYGALFVLCACLAAFSTYPFIQALALSGDGFALTQRFAHYLMFLSILWLQGKLCGLPKRLTYAACAVGALVCASVLIQPLISATRAGQLYAFGSALAAYKLLAAAYLLGAGAWAAWKQKPGSRALLLGLCAFGCALIVDRARPLYEPILFGWPVEHAGTLIALIAAGLLWRDTMRIYRDNAVLAERKKMVEFQLAARAEHLKLQQDYTTRTERLLHETRNHLIVLREYNQKDECGKLASYLDDLLKGGDVAPVSYTENELVNAMLGVQEARAKALEVYWEKDIGMIPKALPLEDADLSAILMNLLDNALDACEKLPREERWVRFEMRREHGILIVDCANAMGAPSGQRTTKAERGHGHGLAVIREAVNKYGGGIDIRHDAYAYSVKIKIPIPDDKVTQPEDRA